MRNKNIEGIYEEALALVNTKNEDYANPDDFYANFRMVEYSGIKTWVGVHVRMLDKISRLQGFVRRFIETGNISSAVDESIEDTLLDTINYAAITLDTYRQYMKGENHELNRNATTNNGCKAKPNTCTASGRKEPKIWSRKPCENEEGC
jgi:hypothetical protein